MLIRVFGLQNDSIVDGPGIRYAVFTQGCPHHCPGCHNPDSHSFDGGQEKDTSEILDAVRKNPLLDGVTFSGGEPFEQPEALAEIAKEVHKLGMNVVTYTGYTFEELLQGKQQRPGWDALMQQTDYLVDGRFERDQRSIALKFKGSANQRVLDMKQSLAAGKAVLSEYN
jgi:anaerobic ribonucleoside-triphosphate reductase activating protein